MLKYPELLRSVYIRRIKTVKQLGLWSGLGIEVCAEDGDLEQSGLWSSLGSHGYFVFTLVVVYISGGQTEHN